MAISNELIKFSDIKAEHSSAYSKKRSHSAETTQINFLMEMKVESIEHCVSLEYSRALMMSYFHI